MKKIFSTYGKSLVEVYGVNQARLISDLAKNGVRVFEVQKKSVKVMRFWVKSQDFEKFFAITDKLCYNVKTIEKKGFVSALEKSAKNIGLILGLVLVVSSMPFFDDYIVNVDFIGDGAIYSEYLTEYLKEKGVEKFTKASTLDFEKLQTDMLTENDFLSYASIYKRGARLKVEVALKSEVQKVLDDTKTELLAGASGIVTEVKVYRGTPMVSVGDLVSSGDLLVSGTVTVRDITVSSNVYASVTIKTEKTYEYLSEYDGFEERAIAFAMAEHGQDAEYSVIKIQENERFVYKVIAKYLVTFTAG